MSKIQDLISKISIHPLFWVVVGIGVVTGRFLEVLMLFLIVFIHEMGHAVTAHFFSWRIKKIELLPFGGVAEMDEYGNRPLKEELLVIMSGPLTHIGMMGVAYIFLSFHWIDEATFQLFMKHNIMILLFNLLPIWPLDGGKLIFLAYSLKLPFSLAHRYALVTSIASVGFLLLITMLIYPFHLNLWIVVAFVVFTHYVEWKQMKFAHIRFLLERYYGKSREIKTLRPIVVDDQEEIIEVFAKFCRGCKHQIILKLNDREQMTFDENELLHAYFTEKRTNGTIREILF